MKIRLRIALVLLPLISGVAQASVTASLDRDSVSAGESVELTLQRDSRGGGEPDLGPLRKDFEVLGTSSGSSIRIVNGQVSETEELRITLSPRHSGRIDVPALSWGNEQTQALSLAVSDGGSSSPSSGSAAGIDAGTATSAHVFLTEALDEKRPYVQGAVLLTLQIHADEPISDASLEFTGNNDVSVQPVGKDQQQTEIRNGRRFMVIERHYLLLPQHSGALHLEGPTFNAQVEDHDLRTPFASDPFFGRMLGASRPLRLHGEAIELDVRARPAEAAGHDWLPAKHVTLEEEWRPNSLSVHAGEPLVLHLRLTAVGLTGAQLPDLGAELVPPDGVKAYPDQGKLDTTLDASDVVGTREQDIALIASAPGHYRIPARRLAWWDIEQNLAREVVLPERELEVLPATGPSTTPPPPAAAISAPPAPPENAVPGPSPRVSPEPSATGVSRWAWISLALVLLWLGTLLAWWWSRRASGPRAAAPADSSRPTAVVDTGPARRAFVEACHRDDPLAARRSLLVWAHALGPSMPAGLNALAARFDDPAIVRLLAELDRACYSGAPWQGGALAKALTRLPQPAPDTPPRGPLAALYP